MAAFAKTLVFLWFAFPCMAHEINAYEPLHVKYTSEDGLRSNFILHLFNDSQGTLWIATDNGLNTYDGKRFRSINLGNTTENCIARIGEDPEGTIWFATLDGKIYSVEEEKAVPHPMNERIFAVSGGSFVPYQLAFGDEGQIFISGKKGILELTDKSVHRVPTGKQGKFLTRGGMILGFTRKGHDSPVPIEFNGQQLVFHDTIVRSFAIHTYSHSSGHAFALANNFHLWIFHGDSINTVQFDSPISNSLFFENDSVLWIGTEGAGAFRIVNGRVTENIFPGSNIYSVLKDFEGGYWFGTGDDGLRYVPAPEVRNLFHDAISMKAHFIDAHNSEIAGLTDDLRLFHGNRFSEPMSIPDQRMGTIFHVWDSDTCDCFSYNSDNTERKITCYDWRTGSGPSFSTSGKALQMAVFGGDTLYSSYGALWFRSGSRHYLTPGNMPAHRVKQLSPANDNGTFWAVSEDGVYLITMHPQLDTVVAVRSYTTLQGAKAMIKLNDLFIVAAGDGYFYSLDTLSGEFSKLPNAGRHEVQCMNAVSATEALVGTANGLVLLHANGSYIECRNLSHELGLPPRLIRDIEVVGDSIFCLTESEIFAFPFPSEQKNSTRGAIAFGKVSINDALAKRGEEQELYTDGRIEFTILTASFKDGYAYTYSFRLLPLDTSWQEGTSEQLTFYNLPPGDYQLNIRDKYGKEATSCFHVEPYFYETSWFMGAGIVLLAALLASPFYFLNRMNVSRARLESEKNRLRLNALTSQLKPHFVFNALSSVQSYVLRKNARESGNYLAKFAMHIRHALEQAGQDEIPLATALESAKNYLDLERMRLENAFDYRIRIDPSIDTEMLKIPVLLLQPYVENAVMHGMLNVMRDGLIEICISRPAPETVVFTVSDNGGGLPASDDEHTHKGNGIGTRINRERMQLLNALYNNRYEVSTCSNTPMPGVTVTIKIDFRL